MSEPTTATDWTFRNVQSLAINGQKFSPSDAAEWLSSCRSGVVAIEAGAEGGIRREFEFEFVLAEEDDLEGVDLALERFISGGELSRGSIDALIMRAKVHRSAERYLGGISNYLYGVLAREELLDSGGDPSTYERRYDEAVQTLGAFDRPPAEAICGLVAFHYNQFARAMSRTKSWRVSDVSRRLLGLLSVHEINRSSLATVAHSTLDRALSDSTVEQVLSLCSIALDGQTAGAADEALRNLSGYRPYDQLKLRLIAAEYLLAAGLNEQARVQAETLRQSAIADEWYAEFRTRLGSGHD